MASEYQRFVGNYMKGRASSNFRDNANLMKEAAAAWRAHKGGGGRARRANPGGSALAVRSNPGGMGPLGWIAIAAVGGYVLNVAAIKGPVDKLLAQLKTAGMPAA